MENLIDYNNPQYPIGQFKRQDIYSQAELLELVESIKAAPEQYAKLVINLSEVELNATYRPGAWSVRQLIHHVADIQMLHFFRMKKAVTESDYVDVTLIDMDKWAETPDSTSAPLSDSLEMFAALTKRYIYLIGALTKEQLDIEYFHPVRGFTVNQKQAIAMSAWHVHHHLAHIRIAIKQAAESGLTE